MKVLIIIILLIPFFCYCQKDSVEVFSIDENYSITQIINSLENKITAFDIGNRYFVYASKGLLDIYDLDLKKWKEKEFKPLLRKEFSYANFGLHNVTSKDIKLISIDNNRNKVGLTLEYGLFKDIELTNLTTDATLLVPQKFYGLKYLTKEDGYVLFYKFHTDEQSDLGSLVGYKMWEYKPGLYTYKESSIPKIDIKRVSTLEFNENETTYGGVTYDSALWLWNKNKINEISYFQNDTNKLLSVSFVNNDTIYLLYNTGNIYFTTISNYTNLLKVNMEGDFKLESFVYNENKHFFVGKYKSTLLIFQLINDNFKIVKKINFQNNIKNFKLSQNGKWLAIVR